MRPYFARRFSGLACEVSKESERMNEQVGTVSYMAPEVKRGPRMAPDRVHSCCLWQ